jgi:hypothetical protein
MLEAPPTPCLRMTNMLSEDMLKDDEEYSEILEDIQEELSQFGKVCMQCCSRLILLPYLPALRER